MVNPHLALAARTPGRGKAHDLEPSDIWVLDLRKHRQLRRRSNFHRPSRPRTVMAVHAR